MTTTTLTCPVSNAPCTTVNCDVQKVNVYGNIYCVVWVEKQRAEGRKQLEDNAQNPPKTRT